MKIIVMRRAVLQEDEGREAYIGQYNSQAEAEAWIAAQEGCYFRPSEYYIPGVNGTTPAGVRCNPSATKR